MTRLACSVAIAVLLTSATSCTLPTFSRTSSTTRPSLSAQKVAPSNVPPPAGVRLDYSTRAPIAQSQVLALTPATRTAADPRTSRRVTIQLYSLASASLDSSTPIAATARLVLATVGERPVRPTMRLTLGSRLAVQQGVPRVPESGSSSQPIGILKAALIPGTTIAAQVIDFSSYSAPSPARPDRQVEFMLHLPADGASTRLQVAIAVQDRVDLVAEGSGDSISQSPPADKAPRQLQRELVILNDLDLDSTLSVSMLVPFKFDRHPYPYVLAAVTVEDGDSSPEHLAALDRAQTALFPAAAASPAPAAMTPEWLTLSAAIGGLADRERQRGALVFLASSTGAAITEDVALVCEDELLAELAGAVQKRVAASPGLRDRQSLAFLLELCSLEVMARLLAEEKLAAELESVLTLHAGEAGRSASSMEQVVTGLASTSELQTRLIAENLIYLEDASPAARVRAYDWLVQRNRAPAGYDPLASPSQRRRAIEQSLNPSTQATMP